MRTHNNSLKTNQIRTKFGSRLAYLAKLGQIVLQNPTMSVVYAISAILCLCSGHFYYALCCSVLGALANPVIIWKVEHQYREVFNRYNINPALFLGTALGLLAGLVLALSWVEPAHAQFFNNAETFLRTQFLPTGAGGAPAGTGAGGDIIKLVMNTLRALFVMYMLFGVVQVFQAVRQGEEWKDLARTPFFVVLAGTVGDVMVGAIVGPGGGAGGI